MDVDRHVLQSLRLAVEDVQIPDFEEGRLDVAKRGFGTRRRLQGAAEIDPAHRFVLHDLLHRALGDALADVHGVNAIDERGDALDVVIDDQHRSAVVAHFDDQPGERRRFARRQAGEGFVDQHHFGIAGDGFGDLHLAQVGERQGRGPPIERRAQPDALGDRARALLDGGVGKKIQQPVGQEPEDDVLEHRLPMQRTRMLEHHPDAEPRDPVRRPAGDLDAVDAHRPGVGPLDAEDRLHHRRLARPVRADQTENLAAPDGEADVLDGGEPAETLVEALDLEHGRPPRSCRLPRALDHAEQAAGKHEHDDQRDRGDDEGREIARADAGFRR